jgi:hypothetical protein
MPGGLALRGEDTMDQNEDVREEQRSADLQQTAS